MSLSIACPGCGKTYDLNDALAGKKARCKDRAMVFIVPTPPKIANLVPRPADLFADPADGAAVATLPPRTSSRDSGGGDDDFEAPRHASNPKPVRRSHRNSSDRVEYDPKYRASLQILGGVFVLYLGYSFFGAWYVVQFGTAPFPIEFHIIVDFMMSFCWLGATAMLLFARPAGIFQQVAKYFVLCFASFIFWLVVMMYTGKFDNRAANNNRPAPPPMRPAAPICKVPQSTPTPHSGNRSTINART